MGLLYSKLGPSVGAFLFWATAGVFGALFRKGSFGVWFMMECSFAGVICFLSGVRIEENERGIKYYVFQVLGSLFLFFRLVSVCRVGLTSTLQIRYFSFYISFCIKLGLFPFHFWVPAVIGLCSWTGCFIVGWLQKISPLWILRLCGIPFDFRAGFEVRVLGSVLIGAVCGVGVHQYRNLLGYSSLVHGGWLVELALCSQFGLLAYIGVYGLALGILIYKINWYGLNSWEDHSNLCSERGFFSWDNELVKMGVFIDWASLAGFPPLLGRVGKILGVYFIYPTYPVVAIILTLRSMISFIYYFRIISNSLISVGKGIWLTNWSRNKLSLSFRRVVHSLRWVFRVFGGIILFILTGIGE